MYGRGDGQACGRRLDGRAAALPSTYFVPANRRRFLTPLTRYWPEARSYNPARRAYRYPNPVDPWWPSRWDGDEDDAVVAPSTSRYYYTAYYRDADGYCTSSLALDVVDAYDGVGRIVASVDDIDWQPLEVLPVGVPPMNVGDVRVMIHTV